jgi:hypothetical protein
MSPKQRNLPEKKHKNPNRQTSIPLGEFEPAIPANERGHTHALDRAVNFPVYYKEQT